MIKVVAVDMDGTFLRDDKSYDVARFERVLDAMDNQEMRFVVASGNQYRQLIGHFPSDYQRLTFVAENGANIISRDKTLVAKFQSHEDVVELVTFVEKEFPDTIICLTGESSAYIRSDVDEKEKSYLSPYLPKMDEVDDLLPLPDDAYFKVVLLMAPEDTKSVQDGVNAHFAQGNLYATSSGFGCIDVISKGAHKAWGLQQLLDQWDLTSQNLMAFGDGMNDYEMLNLANYSYAMANAPQAVKEVARFTAPSNNDDGVLSVWEEYLGLE